MSIPRHQKKSEVYLRAAQSLDQEVQHVKNLKRLSIGSDLIDPDLNMRIDVEESYDADLSKEETSSIYEDSYDESSSSIDRTRVEYLTSNVQEEDLQGQVLDDSEDKHSISGKLARGLGRARSLNGIIRRMGTKHRTLRGTRSMSNLKKKKSNDEGDDERDVGEKLLWVPADQHPSVKPENYLELVKDTLEKIRDIDYGKEDDEQLDGTQNPESNKENIEASKSTGGKLRGGSVVRRPSSLRKSYTEFSTEDLELLDKALDNNRTQITRGNTNKKRLSLREITNELAKHSNKVGLTDDNAITLARTLSIASAIDNTPGSDSLDQLDKTRSLPNDTEEGFASNVFTNNHSLASNSSSLKRSKFNTYRVKPQLKGPLNLTNNKTPRSLNLIARHTWDSNSSNEDSDGSMNYHTDNDMIQKSILDPIDGPMISTISDDDRDISINSFSQDSSMVSSDSTSHSILNRPDESISYISEKLENGNNTIHKGYTTANNSFSTPATDDHKTSGPIRKSFEHRITGAKTLLDSRGQLNESASETNEDEVTAEKKERLDKRITNLFKRKKDKKPDSDYETPKIVLTPTLSPEDKESDQLDQTLNDVIRPISPESTKGGSLISFTPTSDDGESTGSTLLTGRSNSNDEVVEYVQELEDDSRDLSGSDILNELNEEYNRHLEYSIDNSNDSVVYDQSFGDTAETQPIPPQPKKLTFDDVKRPERPNAPMEFTDSAFGFPLPPLTTSTVIMCDHRLGINVERAIYRLSHLKLSDSNRELRQQVLLSNFMYAYLNLVNHTLYMEEAEQKELAPTTTDNEEQEQVYPAVDNQSDGTILIPEL
ncbi:Protein ZDS2 [Nakaseomyces bracarensis]|uniref:Protein ZDS2 n=1 Tax=Nakaseomyces bracarensis TaxID=273131 RepID=A0ABR4P0Z5_9SACH